MKHSNNKGRSGDDGGILNKPKWAHLDMIMFLKDMVSSRTVSGNMVPLEEPQQYQ
jgi:hypothetical protein